MKVLIGIGIIWASLIFILGCVTWVQYLFTFANYLDKRKCWFRHDWNNFQGRIPVSYGATDLVEYNTVLAFDVCKRCAKSRLIHILK